MVGLVVVSHSDTLADGVVRLAREMASAELMIEPAGGIEEPGVLGTDAERVRAAIERAMSPDGVLVLMDLGSALMSAEFAVDLLAGASGPVRLSDAPLVEGTVAAAVAASGGAPLDEVAQEARGALAMKVAQIDSEAPPGPPGDSAPATGATAAEGAQPDGLTVELPVRNRVGLHARPAARFVQTARSFDADVRVAKSGSATTPVSARSLTNLVALGARLGDTVIVTASGPQARAAIDALQELADGGFGDGIEDAALAAGAAASGNGAGAGAASAAAIPAEAVEPAAVEPPRTGEVIDGIPVSGGVAVGPARQVGGGPAGPPPDRSPGTPADELTLLERGLEQVRAELGRDREQLGARAGAAEAAIFDAHLALLDDEALLEPVRAAIAGGATAERAVHDGAGQVAQIYRALTDPLLAERAVDVLDVGARVVAALTGSVRTEAEGIVVADELSPSQTVRFDPERVTAILTARGSITAHAAIIARSLGIPAVLGAGERVLGITDGTTLLLDGDAGTVTVEPDVGMRRKALARREQRRARRAAAVVRAHEPGALAGGEPIDVYANIGNAEDAVRAVELGAEGVGMLRTEFLYLNRPELPDEDAQVEVLREIARTLHGRPLIVRTLDAGADKPLPALPMPPETNPFLGMRGIRVGLAHPEILRTQLRAVLRVAAEYPVNVMMPMVATLGEVLETKRMLARERAELGVDAPVEVGITLEVPSAALMAEQLGRELDFLSLGTNDLTQYTMAAERGDARLASLLMPPQPAVLRLVKLIVEGAAAATRATGRRCWVGICGEMGGDPASAVLLAGLGVDELSMAPGLIPELKATLRSVTLEDARAAARAALDAPDAETARRIALALI